MTANVFINANCIWRPGNRMSHHENLKITSPCLHSTSSQCSKESAHDENHRWNEMSDSIFQRTYGYITNRNTRSRSCILLLVTAKMTTKTNTIVARYYRFLKDVFSDLDEYNQTQFWEFIGHPDTRFKDLTCIPPTWQEKLIAFDGEQKLIDEFSH